MSSILRSEEMCLAQLFLQSDAAYSCISELGELGLVQFRDLNADVSAFQRKFVPELRRCDEMERKLRYLDEELQKAEIPVIDNNESPEAPLPKETLPLENDLEQLEKQMREVSQNQEQLNKNFLELTELKHVLRKTQSFFEEAQDFAAQRPGAVDPETGEEESSGHEEMSSNPLRLGFIAGVIVRERIPLFERILWRACRGNVFLRHIEIDAPLKDPVTGHEVHKSVFIIFYQGEQLRSRTKKICESLKASIYPCPENPQERREVAMNVMTRIQDLDQVLKTTNEQRNRILAQVARNIRVWFIKVRKVTAIYHSLNMFSVDLGQRCLIGEIWCPVSEIDRIQLALRRGTERCGASVNSILHRIKTNMTPPTYFRTDKFTTGFQAIIEAYGVADYREINPAFFTIISFPFLYGVMFGDMGHGIIMALVAAFMCWKETEIGRKKDLNEMVAILFHGRYIILLMGLFSTYAGFIYNDIFSKSLNIFGSYWTVSDQPGIEDWIKTAPAESTIQLNPNFTSDGPYPYGMDPIWQLSSNKIVFIDSFKMKGSVILGVTHMCFGLVLAYFNHRHFNDHVTIIWEWIPRCLFMGCIFVYLCLTIFIKWIFWDASTSGNAPSLLINLIGMFMLKTPTKEDNTWVYGSLNAEGEATAQGLVQKLLLLIAFASLPVMLLAKPYIKYKEWKDKRNRSTANFGGVRVEIEGNDDTEGILDGDELARESGSDHQPQEEVEEFDVGGMMILQIIHTIEFALGCISHTASYLRLWALSLAHAELSEVLWTMVLKMGLSMSSSGSVGAIMSYLVFWAFAALSVGILICMEGLSAFLHAMRLHWVEFNDKFYGGEGIAFKPFYFETILSGEE